MSYWKICLLGLGMICITACQSGSNESYALNFDKEREVKYRLSIDQVSINTNSLFKGKFDEDTFHNSTSGKMKLQIQADQTANWAFYNMRSLGKLKSDEKYEEKDLADTNMPGFKANGENPKHPQFLSNFQTYFPLPLVKGNRTKFEYPIEMPFELDREAIPFRGKTKIELLGHQEINGVKAMHLKAYTLIDQLEIPKDKNQDQKYHIESKFEGYFNQELGHFISASIDIVSKGLIIGESAIRRKDGKAETLSIYSREKVEYELEE